MNFVRLGKMGGEEAFGKGWDSPYEKNFIK